MTIRYNYLEEKKKKRRLEKEKKIRDNMSDEEKAEIAAANLARIEDQRLQRIERLRNPPSVQWNPPCNYDVNELVNEMAEDQRRKDYQREHDYWFRLSMDPDIGWRRNLYSSS